MVSEEEIPEHWRWSNIGSEVYIELGNSPPGDSYNEKGDGEPFLQGASRFGEKHPSEGKYTTEPNKFCKEGDILITIRAGVGDLNIADKEYCIGRGIAALRGEESIKNGFLHYYLKALKPYWEEVSSGSTYSSITKTNIQNAPLPVPSLEEQELIVEKLDVIFDRIKQIQDAQEQAEKIYQDLAFSFFTSRVKDAHTEIVDTSDLIEASQYGSSNATNSEGNGYPSLRMGNYNLRGEMDYSKIKYQEFDGKGEFEKYKLEEGDILFNRTNSKKLVGKMCIYDGHLEDAVFASYLIRVELNESKVLPEYFVTYMNSHLGEVQRQSKLKQAVSQANINATELREMEMKIPSLEVQKEIVTSLEYMRSKIDEIMSEVNKKQELIENLPKSVLAEAFKGNLTDFDPDSDSETSLNAEKHDVRKEGQQRLGEFE